MKFLVASIFLFAAVSFASGQFWGSEWFSCGRYDPCGLGKSQYYFPSYYPQYYIQCGLTREQCFFQMCPSGTIWKQAVLACVHDSIPPPPAPVIPLFPQSPYITGTYNCEDKNPCTPGNAAFNRFYFPHVVVGKYVQCDNFQKCFTRDCPQGEEWDAAGYTCIKS